MSGSTPHRGSRPYLIFGVIVVALLGTFVFWQTMNVPPQLTIPTPVMPSPNAFDSYQKAIKSYSDKGSHSLEIYQWMAVDNIMPGQAMEHPVDDIHTAPSHTQLYADLTPVFSMVRKGFRADYRQPPIRSLESFSSSNSDLSIARKISRLLALDIVIRRRNGDYSGAITSAIDGMQLGIDIPHGGPVICMLYGNALQAIARQQIREIVPHLDAAQAYAACRRLTTIIAQNCPYTDTLQEEQWAWEAMMLEILQQRDWRKKLQGLAGEDAGFRLYLVTKRSLLLDYDRYMHNLIAVVRQPYAARLPEPNVPGDPVNQRICPVFAKTRIKYEVNATQNALLLCTLALQAYHAEHGAYPAALSDLAPKYLPTLPADPFALKGSLRYKQTGKSYVLYSIGPDGKDDGGTPSEDGKRQAGKTTSKAPNRIISTSDRSIGDIVAGVNIQ